jgi:HK97 gp10 family phage protein
MVVNGLQELQVKFKGMSLVFSHKVVGSAIYKSAKPMEDEAKRLVSTKIKDKVKSTGNLERSIGRVRTPIRKANTIGEVKLGPRIGAKTGDTSTGASRRRGYHAHFVEFGAGPRKPGGWYAKFNNPHPTVMKPQPFLAPAYLAKNQDVLSNIGNNMQKVLQRYVKTGQVAEII